MNKEKLLERLEASRAEFMESLDALPEESLTVPGASGERSVKDLLAHLTMWEAQLITLLFRMGSGKTPNTAHFKSAPRAQINADWHRQHADRPLEIILTDFEGIRRQTIRRVEAIPEHDLNHPGKFSWLDGRPLRDWILRDTIEHEQLHLAEIREWMEADDGRH